jgi:hypothetical protein
VVQDGPDPAQLLAAAGPAGAAVDQVRQRGAVAGRLAGVVAVEDQQAAVPGGDAETTWRAKPGRAVTTDPTRLPAQGGQLDRVGRRPGSR